MSLRALSVRQPYASLIISGSKRYEARGWNTNYRGPLLIHASSAKPGAAAMHEFRTRRALNGCAKKLGWTTEEAIRSLPRSAIVGQVQLKAVYAPEDVEDMEFSDLDEDACGGVDGVYLWELSDPVTIEPVPCNGKLNIWSLDSELEAIVGGRLSSHHGSKAREPSVNSGGSTPLTLELWRATGLLAAALGEAPLTMREVFRTFFSLPGLSVDEADTALVIENDELIFLATNEHTIPFDQVGERLQPFLTKSPGT